MGNLQLTCSETSWLCCKCLKWCGLKHPGRWNAWHWCISECSQEGLANYLHPLNTVLGVGKVSFLNKQSGSTLRGPDWNATALAIWSILFWSAAPERDVTANCLTRLGKDSQNRTTPNHQPTPSTSKRQQTTSNNQKQWPTSKQYTSEETTAVPTTNNTNSNINNHENTEHPVLGDEKTSRLGFSQGRIHGWKAGINKTTIVYIEVVAKEIGPSRTATAKLCHTLWILWLIQKPSCNYYIIYDYTNMTFEYTFIVVIQIYTNQTLN